MPVGLQYLLGVLALTLLRSRLESGDAMVAYSPQRVLRLFGFDQGVACATEASCINVRGAESRYMAGGRENLLGTFSSIFWPSLVRKGASFIGRGLSKLSPTS